jgi:eukaryotic translation initiation factor 2C
MIKVNDGSTVGQRAADEVERLTHAMCYIFGRATKAVSLCPPAYYADIVCERARVWLSGIFDERSVASSQAQARDEDVRVHPKLKDTMFYM